MSTSETVEFDLCPCPCGSGRIVKSITTQDNPWSTADVHQYINCARCSTEWRLEHNRLTLISSETDYRAAQRNEHFCREQLYALVVPLVDEYFRTFAAKTKKAEHEEMTRLGIFNGNYRDFLQRKRQQSGGQICNAFGNLEWLSGLAHAASLGKDFEQAHLAYQRAKAGTSAAANTIVRRRLPEQRTA